MRGQDSPRQRLLIRPDLGDFGWVGTQAQIEYWFAAAGFDLTGTKRSGPMLFFEAQQA